MKISSITQLLVNLSLCVLMLKTKRRKKYLSEDYGINYQFSSLSAKPLIDDFSTEGRRTVGRSIREGQLRIEIKMDRKIVEVSSYSAYQFTVVPKGGSKLGHRVQHTFDEFMQLDKFLNEEFSANKYPSLKKKLPSLNKNALQQNQ